MKYIQYYQKYEVSASTEDQTFIFMTISGYTYLSDVPRSRRKG